MEFVEERLCRYFHAGQVIQLVSPGRTLFAEVLNCAPDQVTAKSEGPTPDARRVLVRAPVRRAIFEASAQMTPMIQMPDTFILRTFANMQCTERRAFGRLDEPVPTHVYRDGGPSPYHRIAAINLGASGLLLGWPNTPEVSLGERVRLEVALDDASLPAIGEVVRIDGCRSAIRFLEISTEDQDRITAYVFRQEVLA